MSSELDRKAYGVRIRRVLVAMDASPHSLAALDAATDMAARFRAELQGLFVQDLNLLRLAQLPFAQEVGQFSARERRIDSEEMERQLRMQSARVRRIFDGRTRHAHLRCSFQVARGVVHREVLSAASDADLLVLGRAGWSLLSPRRLGTTTRAILAQAPGLVLVLQRETCLGQPTVVIYDGSALSKKALEMAVELVDSPLPERSVRGGGKQKQESGVPISIFLLGSGGADTLQTLRREVEEWLAQRAPDLKVRFRALTDERVSRLADYIIREECGILMVPARSAILRDTALQGLIDKVEVPVLLVS
ncbi:MAG TPA: universal stress protein [Anaerolineae bacterium]|nr:universal stress protein [Anaerolineae bacterium]